MQWHDAKMIIDGNAKGKDVSGEFKALLTTLVINEVITLSQAKSILTWCDSINPFTGKKFD